MKLTERQEKILGIAIREYVATAQPVSSQELLKKHDFDLSPATIRNELQKLTDKGFLSQPHTSAGRIPTDKGYRFFVNNLLKGQENAVATDATDVKKEIKKTGKIRQEKLEKKLEIGEWSGEKEDPLRFIQNLTRYLAQESRALALNYFEDEDILWKEGWEGLLCEPEFEERDNIIDLTRLLGSFEERLEDLKKEQGLNVYIGKENPYPKAKNFTVISSHYKLPGGGQGTISIIGPKRMEYDKNITLINSLMKLLEDI